MPLFETPLSIIQKINFDKITVTKSDLGHINTMYQL